MQVEELGLHQHLAWAGVEGLPVWGQEDAQHAAGAHGGHHRSGYSHHPCLVHAGVGGQPVRGQNDAPQAAEAHGGHHRAGDSHHPRQVGAGVGLEDSLLGDKTMPHRPRKPMATSAMVQCCPKATETQ